MFSVPGIGGEKHKPLEKAPIHGLVSMGKLNFVYRAGDPEDPMLEANTHPGVYSAVVINVTWEQLEPVKGELKTDFIDQALAEIRAYNRKYPNAPVTAKLRVHAGNKAPRWVKTLDGGPIRIMHRQFPVDVPAFWTEHYRTAWRTLQKELAERYDDDPLVGEVAVSSCSTVTDEPFILPMDPLSKSNLHKAGLTDANRKACLQGVAEDYSFWKRTPLDFTFNPFFANDGPRSVREIDFTVSVMRDWRKRLGSRGILAHHGLDEKPRPQAMEIYETMTSLGPPIELQAVSPRVNADGAFEYALRTKATEVEVWQTKDAGGLSDISMQKLQAWAARMR